MKPAYGAINDIGQWWDSKCWRNWADANDADGSTQDALRILSTTTAHDEKNCHMDGCFECPRCRLTHFIPDNYDLLCDACCSLVLQHPSATGEQIEGIKLWQQKARNYYSPVGDEDISERHKLRERLTESNIVA